MSSVGRGAERPARLRLFVAVTVPESIRDAVDQAVSPLRIAAPELRWTDPEGWHLTIWFLGGVEQDRVPEVEAGVAQVAAGGHPFTLRLSGAAGTFPSGVLWAGIEPAPMLEELALGLAAAFSSEVERPFHAHLTLARTGSGRRSPPELAERYEGPTLPWTVRHLALMRSRLAVGGARYEIVRQWPLGGQGSSPG
jgi:RNA 2',3'-cyclic 3'-phosphodiesterase